MSTSENTISDQRSLDRLIDELETEIELGNLSLTYLQGLTPDQRRVQLNQRILLIAARTGIRDTQVFRWGIELSLDDARAQASVRELARLKPPDLQMAVNYSRKSRTLIHRGQGGCWKLLFRDPIKASHADNPFINRTLLNAFTELYALDEESRFELTQVKEGVTSICHIIKSDKGIGAHEVIASLPQYFVLGFTPSSVGTG